MDTNKLGLPYLITKIIQTASLNEFGVVGNKKKTNFNDLLNCRYKNYLVAQLLSSNANDWLVIN